MATVNTTLRTGKTVLRATPSEVEQFNRHATDAALGQEAASVAAAAREELRECERMYLGAAMADFEAMSYQGIRNRGSVIDEAEEGDYDTKNRMKNAMKNANPASGGAAALVP